MGTLGQAEHEALESAVAAQAMYAEIAACAADWLRR